MTPIVTFNDDGTSKLSFVTVGGQIDILFFIHGSAQDVIKRYQEFMGARPKLPPFWALGWMQASYAWKTQQMVEDAVNQYRTQGFPLDAIFLDISYMDNYVDFTVDKKNFPNVPALADDLHAHDQHLIPIIDAAISAEDLNNPYYSQGNSDDIFIKSTKYNSTKYNNNLINQVWPKVSVFVDWFNNKCTNMWFQGLDDLFNRTLNDGVWIDMNEPWGFQTAEIDPSKNAAETPSEVRPHRRFLLESATGDKNYDWYKTFNSDKESTWYLPFLPDFENYQSYDNNTISLNATNPSMHTIQYNLHDFYGHMMAKRTAQYFQSLKQDDPRKDKRSFILTRSTFTSTG
jgi:alpha-glucosidase (family GH31 glycosyl hydrolase)